MYIYVNKKDNEKVYVGSAISQTILRRQQQHLCSASRAKKHIGKFDEILSHDFDVEDWYFDALSMQGFSPQQIRDAERQLILKYKSNLDQYGYNTQLPGGR